MIKKNRIILNTLLILIAFFAFNININAASNVTCKILKGNQDNNTKSNSGNIKTFRYTAQCSDGTSYIAFCLDPAKTSNAEGGSFKKQDDNSMASFMSTVYDLYKSNKYCQSGEDGCIVKFQTIVRIAEFDGAIGYKPRSGWLGEETKAAYNAFKSKSADNCYGGTCASEIYNNELKGNNKNSSLTKTTTTFVKSGNNIELRINGRNDKPIKITYSINGRTYEVKDPEGTLNGNTFTTIVPSSYLSSLEECVELNGDIVYTGGSDGNDLSNFPIFKSTADRDGEVQNYIGMPISGNNNNEIHISANTHIGPKNKKKNDNTPDICDANPEYDEDKPIPCKTEASLTCEEPASNDPTASKVFTYNEGTADGTGITDWESCIIHNTDIKGNSYDIEMPNLTSSAYIYDGGWKTITDAKFCNISCKEKYDIKMPASRDNVKFGTYFAFDIAPDQKPRHAIVGVQSEKQCVTSGSTNMNGGIEIEKYEKRVLSLRKQQIDMVNLYNYYKALYDELSKSDHKNDFVNGNYGYGINVSKSSRRESLNDESGHMNSSSSDWNNYKYTEWKSSQGWNDSNEQDIVSNVSFNYGISYVQYSLTSNDVYANIITNNVNGNTSNSFNNMYSAYLKENGNDFYCSMFGICNIDRINGNIDSIDKVFASTSFEYHYDNPSSSNGSVQINEESSSTGSIYAEIEFQEYSQREASYNQMLQAIDDIINKVNGRIGSLSNQIAAQGKGISDCTEQITQLDDYNFEPKIKWDYDEDYVNMMKNPNELELSNDDSGNNNPTKSEPKYSYCDLSYSGDAAGVFDGCNSGANPVSFKYLDINGSPNSETNYNRVSRVGLTINYNCANSDGYCYYGSNTQFYTYPPDGKVTTDGNITNAAIIEDDGYVFPVTITSESGNKSFSLKFENIGQYISGNNKGELGRIMGDNGVLNGDYKNNAVCYYKVYKPTTNPKCDDIVEEYCKKDGKYTKDQKEFNTCIHELLAVRVNNNPVCCDIAYGLSEKALEIGVKWTEPISTEYFNACEGPKTCSGFKIADKLDSKSTYKSALVNSNGDLQFTVRTVSLNNLFPNGDKTKGLNWSSGYMTTVRNGDKQSRYVGDRNLDIQTIIEQIQNNGDSIYGGTPDYSCILTPKCTQWLKSYNKSHDLDRGYLDYNLDVNNKDEYGHYLESYAVNENFFKLLNENGCDCKSNKNSNNLGIVGSSKKK